MPSSLITLMRLSHSFMRGTAGVVLITFSLMVLQPAITAVQAATATPTAAPDDSAETQLANTLVQIEEKLAKLEDKLQNGQDVAAERSDIKLLKATLSPLDAAVKANFAQVEQHIHDHALPQVILDRHQAMVDTYTRELNDLTRELDGIESAGDDTGRLTHAKTAKGQLKAKKNKRTHLPSDPNNLPFQASKNKVRPPKETQEELEQIIAQNDPVQVAALELSAGMLAATTPSLTPSTADLAETEDVQITDDIKALAAELNYQPVAIYNWVRNHIEYLPTYGSIQGSQLTLTNKRGNAFDTASLLIALLRASHIPARYAYGTVQMPIDKVMNWVGGVETPMAALDLMGQGGIPVTGLAQGGVIKYAKLEHIWVEAWVDYHPSRGAKNKTGDSWVPMDASFKQYDYSNGMDIEGAVPLDGQVLLEQIQTGATLNTSGGWVQNLNEMALKTALTDYQNQIKTYIEGQMPNATTGDVFGDKKIVEQNPPILMSGLSYKTVARAGAFAEMPNKLRHFFTLKLFSTAYDRASESPSLNYSISLAKINSHRISLTFIPSSDADAQLLQSYRDQENSSELPLYLIHVQPVLQLDSETLVTNGSVVMGSDQYWETSFSSPNSVNSYAHTYDIVAGDEVVFSVNGNGLTPSAIKARATAVNSDTASENLHQAALHYWVVNDELGKIIAKSQGLVSQRNLSTGLFSSPLAVKYLFGIPRLGSYRSRLMDISRLMTAVSGQDRLSRAHYMGLIGALGSSLEGIIFEKLFGGKPGSGNSTVQLLVAANEAHLPLYILNEDNLPTALPRLKQSQEVLTDITQAVNTGKVVIMPESAITRFGWSGTGYLIQDPVTGEGAYLIAGGQNGGELVDCRKQKEPLTSAISDYVLTMALIAALALAAALAGAEAGLGAALLETMGATVDIKALMVTFGLSSLVLVTGANASQNSYAYPPGSKICGGGDCGTPAMYRAATDACPWPNMDCIRPNDIKSDAFVIENGIESLDPAK
jgi:hypothetical protein